MGDNSQLLVMGVGFFLLVFYRRIRATLHDLSVLTRAFRKEFGADVQPTPELRPER